MFYSGKESEQFWARVKALPEGTVKDAVYDWGVDLQEIEEHTLKLLERAEAKKP